MPTGPGNTPLPPRRGKRLGARFSSAKGKKVTMGPGEMPPPLPQRGKRLDARFPPSGIGKRGGRIFPLSTLRGSLRPERPELPGGGRERAGDHDGTG